MRLLFFIHAISGGGAERVLATVVNELVNESNELFLATDIKEDFAFRIDERVNCQDLYEGYKKDGSILSAIKLRRNIRHIAKNISPDVIIAFGSSLGCTTIFSTLGMKIPVIVCEHTNVSRFRGYFLNIKRNLLYPMASCITVLTRYDYSLWHKKFRNVVYMPNPVDLVSEGLSKVRSKVVLSVGRVNQWKIKGFDTLIKCWSQLCDVFPDWKLQIVGAGNDESFSYLRSIMEETKCKNVEFLGFRKDVKDLMLSSEIFCLSSRVEGLPMALIEAMNAGCCCVSFDVKTGPREIIINGKSGLIVADQNVEDLKEKLSLVLMNESMRRSFAFFAPESVKKYSIERVIRRWNIMFDKVLK